MTNTADAEHDIAVVRDIYQGMAAKDIERLIQLIDPECVITQDSSLPWGGRHVGLEGFAAFAAALTGNIDSAVTTDAMFAADGDVIQVGRTRGTTVRDGTAFDVAEVHRWTIRDGKAVAAHFSIDTPAMLAALAT
jgi:ketosteroid isomerase-like protein